MCPVYVLTYVLFTETNCCLLCKILLPYYQTEWHEGENMMSVGTTEAFMRALSNFPNLEMEPPTMGEEHMKAYPLIGK